MPRPTNASIAEREALAFIGLRHCASCNTLKTLDAFGRMAASKDGLQRGCRPCINGRNRRYDRDVKARDPEAYSARWAGYQREWKRKNPEKHRANVRRHNLTRKGVTSAQFDALVERQQGACAICGRQPSGGGPGGTLHVDHDHTTGAIRGLLCAACNPALGAFQDSPEVLRAAIAYLAAHSPVRP